MNSQASAFSPKISFDSALCFPQGAIESPYQVDVPKSTLNNVSSYSLSIVSSATIPSFLTIELSELTKILFHLEAPQSGHVALFAAAEASSPPEQCGGILSRLDDGPLLFGNVCPVLSGMF